MEAKKGNSFQTLSENVGKFHLARKTLLIPEMGRIPAHLFAACFRGFGVRAVVMDTYKGLADGLRYTSGKECYPCQVTMGDILHFFQEEQKRLQGAFDPENYAYLLPESDGPCRFGMYNKYQRIVLDSFPGLSKVKIVSPTTNDGYSLDGLLAKDQAQDFRKSGYFAFVVGDILDRLLWRIRPYENERGKTDEFIERAMGVMERTFEACSARKEFGRILDKLAEIIEKGKTLIDPDVSPKPLIGIVGEIYLRTHVPANQDLIKTLEKHGAEVVNASMAEWVNYVSYGELRRAVEEFTLYLKQLRFKPMRTRLKRILGFAGDLFYKEFRQRGIYRRVKKLIDLADDHKIAHLEHVLEKEAVFSFDVTTETCLSIATILEYARGGFNGVVNVYPFSCMPSMTTSAIVKPILSKERMPYLDVPCDATIHPGRESAIKTFMYQAYQHFTRNGRRRF